MQKQKVEELLKKAAGDTSKVRHSDVEIDTQESVGEAEATETNGGEVLQMAEEETRLTNDNLPIIQPTDKKAVLCVRDDYSLMIMPVYDAESLIVENCKLYLQNNKTGVVHIGARSELKIDKSKLLGATDHGVMKILKKFTVNFTEDDKKLAFERAKIFLENLKTMVAVSSSMTIQEAYTEVIRFAIEKAKTETNAGVTEPDKKCKHDKEMHVVYIKDKYMQEVLDEVGAGYTKVIFCKKLCLLEAHYGKEIILRNNGRYGHNETGNLRFYKFQIVDELLVKEDKVQ